MKRPTSLSAILAILLLAATSHAEPVITLPLDGYYRPGKFFPVKIESDREVAVEVKADAVSSRGRGRSIVLPAMSLSRVPNTVKVTIDGKTTDLPIRPLETSQKLTVTLGPTFATDGLRVALPDTTLAQVSQAYESADVVISQDAGAPAAAKLRACGVAVLRVPGDVTLALRGPTSSLDDPRPYDVPFVPSRGIVTRATVFLLTAVFAILVVGLTLWRSRFAWAGVCVLSLAAVGYGGYRWHASSPVSELRGEITYAAGPDVFRDYWTVQGSLEDTADAFDSGTAIMRPIFAGQADRLAMVIELTNQGWRYQFRLPRQTRIAFLRRELETSAREGVGPGSGGAFRDLMKSYYLRAGETLACGLIRDQGGYETYWIPSKK